VPRSEWLAGNRQILLMQIKNTIGREECRHTAPLLNRAWQFLDVFLPARAVYYFVRPAFIGCLVISMVFGGWVTGVSASYNSLPGDVLYPVKIATEAVQTTLAPNKKEEIKLRVEFAARRAEEVKTITKGTAPGKEKKVATAVKNLKSNLETVKSGLDEMKKDSPLQVVDVAKAVSAQTAEIEKKLDQSKTGPVTAESKEQVKQATAAAEEAGVKAVEVIVAKHVEDKNSVSSAEVASVVDDKLKTAEEKVAKVREQIGALAATATSTAAATLTTKAEVKEAVKAVEAATVPLKQGMEAAKEVLTQAKELLAQQNFTSAVDKIKEGNALTEQAENKVEQAVWPGVVSVTAASSTPSVPTTAASSSAAAATTLPVVGSASSSTSASPAVKSGASATSSVKKLD